MSRPPLAPRRIADDDVTSTVSADAAAGQALTTVLRLPTQGGKWASQFALPKPKTSPSTADGATAATPAIRSSGHTTQMMVQIDGGARWLFKHYAHIESAHAEAALTAMYRRVSADTVPQCSVVYDPKTRACVGAAVKLFNNFTDLHDFLAAPARGEEPLDAHQYAYLQRAHEVDLTAFKTKPELDQKIEFLVAIGLAEALVMAYYFEDDDRHKKNFAITFQQTRDAAGKVVRTYKLVSIDFDRSAYAVIFPFVDVRTLADKPPKESYPITAHDLENFPDIRDADPWYWLTKYRTIAREHGYSSVENAAFKKLKLHQGFRHRMYMMLLRIMITPNASYKGDIERHCGTAPLARELHEHFARRKKHLRTVLVPTAGFQNWWHHLEGRLTVEHILAELRRQDRLLPQRSSGLHVKQLYWNLCRDVSKPLFDQSITALERLIRRCESGSPLEQALQAMRQVYHEKCQAFFDPSLKLVPLLSIFDFIRQSNNTLAAVMGICGKPCRAPGAPEASERSCLLTTEQEVLLTHFYTPLRKAVHQLRQSEHMQPELLPATATYGLQSVVFGTAEPDDFSRVAITTSTAKQRRAALIQQTAAWMCEPGNRRYIEKLYHHSYMAYQYYLSGSRVGAWFNTSTYNRRAAADVLKGYGQLTAASSVVKRLRTVLAILQASGDWKPDSFNMRFVIALLRHQKQLISAKSVIDQINTGGVTATEIRDISMPAMSSDPVMVKGLLLELHQAVARLAASDEVKPDRAAGASGAAAAESVMDDDEGWEMVDLSASVMMAPAKR